ncbi:MAG: S10 family peptidase [Dokdonella sp.]|uniref:S10 family peptidase n=1 Tax=Dokdonella sp. TaxID=2291710 RepID=UPI003F7FDA63
MRRNPFRALLASLLLACSIAAQAADGDQDAESADKDAKSAKKDEKPIPAERTAVSHGSVEVAGRTVRYTATAGNVLIQDKENKPNASVFYVAYTADAARGAGERPVTFFYNGGPGSPSVWLHMGSVAPVRVESASAEATAPPPYRLVPNAYSLIDRSDLVFIDAVGTGFSTPVGKGKGKDFWGVDQDLDAFAKTITRYVSINHRWNAPKFLFGESYGTTRSAGLVNKLQNDGMAFNGVVLLSSSLNYGANSPGLDHTYVGALPTLAAIAWYHDKVPNKPAELRTFLDEARAFAAGEYAAALAKGQDLSAAELDAMATKLSRYTGLSPQYLEEANLRVNQSRFRKELLRDERRTVGRYDGRYEGIDLDAAGENPEFDASSTAITGAYIGAFNHYAEDTLKWSSDTPYVRTGPDIIREWDWKHEQPGSRVPQRVPYVAGDLARAMRENPKLQVLSANGWFDLATPFFATEYDISHMQLDPSLRGNVTFTYYPSGHMVYLNVDALKQFKADLDRFYDHALGVATR